MEPDMVISSLSNETIGKIHAEHITLDSELRALPDSVLREFGLLWGDIARLRKRTRTNDDDDDNNEDDDCARTRRDATNRARNTEFLVSRGIVTDPFEVAHLSPKNWAAGLVHLPDRWRLLLPSTPAQAWEEIRFVTRVASQIVGGTLPDAELVIWCRLVVLLGKLRFPQQAWDIERLFDARLVTEKEDLHHPGVQVRMIHEFFKQLEDTSKKRTPGPDPPNNSPKDTNKETASRTGYQGRNYNPNFRHNSSSNNNNYKKPTTTNPGN
jgi:hypothetical protein